MKEPKSEISVESAYGVVVGDHNTVIQNFTAGIASLPIDYTSRIQNFLIEYLGTPKRPVPFGGREFALTMLDTWLDDPQASPYLFLAARAGRGKSALLARWSERLLSKTNLSLIFLPISIRFQTNLAGVIFPTLAARLASLLGEKLPTNLSTSIEAWQALIADYLSRPLPNEHRLLIILDGLDEAADLPINPNLFPLAPREGLRVIVSARYLVDDIDARKWLDRLGWSRNGLAQISDLEPLSLEGVADVLLNMGFPIARLGSQFDIITQLYRLSEGDPLLVQLYVEDLGKGKAGIARLRPEELSTINPGLRGYFSRWWEDQRSLWGDQAPIREPQVQSLFSILACALGPLTREDVLRLVPLEIKLTTLMLHEALLPLKRFVIGDGRRQGYIFSHPRLASYFYEEELSESEQRAVESRFLDIGKRTLMELRERRLLPESASPYIVQYYSAHLERMGCNTETFLALVSGEWLSAWEVLEGTNSGFLNDAERAWRLTEQGDEQAARTGLVTPYLGGEILCALCRASVNSLTRNIPPPLLISLVKKEVWTPAESLFYARQIPEIAERAKALTRLLPYLGEFLKTEVLQEILQALGVIAYEGERAAVLIELAPFLSDDSLKEALLVAQVESFRTEAVIQLAPYLPPEGLLNALKVARKIRQVYSRSAALTKLAPYLPELLLEDALKSARAMRVNLYRVLTLADLAPYLTEELRSIALQKAEIALGMIEEERHRVRALAKLAPHLSEAKQQELLKIAREINDKRYRAEALIVLSRCLPGNMKDKLSQEALEIARADNSIFRAITLIVVTRNLSESLKFGVLQEAWEAARIIQDKDVRFQVLTVLVPYLPENLKRKALEAIRSIRFGVARARALADLAPHLPESLLREALRLARSIEKTAYREQVLNQLAPYLPEHLLQEAVETIWQGIDQARLLAMFAPYLSRSLLDESLKTLHTIKDEAAQAIVLAKLAPYLPKQLLWQVLQTVIAVYQGADLAKSLAELSPYLSEKLFREAIEAAQLIDNAADQAEILTKMIPHVSKELKTGLLRKALEAACAIYDEVDRIQYLIKLAPHLAKEQKKERARMLLEAVEIVKDKAEQARTLMKLTSALPEELKGEVLRAALKAVRLIDEENFQEVNAKVISQAPLISIGPYLLDAPLRERLKKMQVAWNTEQTRLPADQREVAKRARMQLKLLPSLSGDVKNEEVLSALQTVREIKIPGYRAKMMLRLVPYLPVSLKAEVLMDALEAGLVIRDREYRIEVREEITSFLTESILREMLEIICLREEEMSRAVGLAVLTPHLPKTLLRDYPKIAPSIRKEEAERWVLAKQGDYSSDLKAEVLEGMNTKKYQGCRAELLAELSSYMPEGQKNKILEEAIEAVRAIEYEVIRPLVLSHMIPYLHEDKKNEVLEEAIETARAIEHEDVRTIVLTQLIPYMSDEWKNEVLRETLEGVWTIKFEEVRVIVLKRILPYISEEEKKEISNEVLKVVQAINDEPQGEKSLKERSSHATEKPNTEDLQKILKSVRKIDNKAHRVEELTKLTDNLAILSPILLYPLWRETLHTLANRTRQDLLEDLLALIPVISRLGGNEALIETARAILKVAIWWP